MTKLEYHLYAISGATECFQVFSDLGGHLKKHWRAKMLADTRFCTAGLFTEFCLEIFNNNSLPFVVIVFLLFFTNYL
jgi:hypothetical protein